MFPSHKHFAAAGRKDNTVDMNLGFASPVSLQLLRHLVTDGANMPAGYQFAPSADWVQELMRRGHHVTIYTTAREIDAPKTFRGENISIRIARQRPRGAARDLFAAERSQLKQMMVEDQCQLIHAHWTYEFALAALASGIPTLVTIHDLPWMVLRHFRDLHRAARLIMAYEVAFRGGHFTAVSEDAASHFRRYLKPGAQIKVVPNGLPTSIFEMSSQPSRRSSEEITFATILQGWSRRKNAAAALKAFNIVQRQVPGVRLLMFGLDYEQDGPAQKWAIQKNLDAGVTFVGVLPYQSLLQRVSEEVDVIVHPSLDEAFSMTALEGLALKKAFIAGETTPGMREMLGFGRGGILVNVRDPAAMAQAMVQLARDATFRDGMAKAGYERALSLYRLDAVMAKYEALYKSLPSV